MSLDYADESELMRTCGHLYVSIALESLATTLMCLTFSYLLLLITNKGRLKTPGRAAFTFIAKQASSFYRDLISEVSRWRQMPDLPLKDRFALCRKVNQAVCMFQILIGLLTIERWLHINNVNGFRYLGYAVTCPPMQTELIILIAPVVPCYRLQCYTTYVLTTVMLLLGYVASMMSGEVYHGNLADLFTGGEGFHPTSKFWVTFSSCAIQVYLTFIQIPYLWVIYKWKGGLKAGLPYGYTKLLIIVSVTWFAFPLWWGLSYEGLNILTDTKMNAAGFAVLNVIAKGSYTVTMLSMSKWHHRERKRREALERGRRPSTGSDGSGIFNFNSSSEMQPCHLKSETNRDTLWLVQTLMPYDNPGAQAGPWLKLETSYRAYLLGSGISPAIYDRMGTAERRNLQDAYESTTNLMLADSPEALDEKAGSFEEAFGPGAPVPPPVKEDGLPARDEGGTEQTEAADGAASEAELAETTTKSREAEPGDCGAPSELGLRVGRTVTTAHGHEGRVLKVLERERAVQIVERGGRPLTVSIDDLTVLKVLILGVGGLQDVVPQGEARVFCSALVDDCLSSEVATALRRVDGSAAGWEEELDVHGFRPGSRVTLRLWGADPAGGSRRLLGEAGLDGEAIEEGGFDGGLQLFSEGGQGTSAHLRVLAFAVNLPGALGGDAGVPIARSASPKMHGGKAGEVVCCF